MSFIGRVSSYKLRLRFPLRIFHLANNWGDVCYSTAEDIKVRSMHRKQNIRLYSTIYCPHEHEIPPARSQQSSTPRWKNRERCDRNLLVVLDVLSPSVTQSQHFTAYELSLITPDAASTTYIDVCCVLSKPHAKFCLTTVPLQQMPQELESTNGLRLSQCMMAGH